MIRALVDTTVLVSAFVFGGAPGEVVTHAEAGSFQLICSEELLDELGNTLRKPKFRKYDLTEPVIAAIQSHLRRFGDVVSELEGVPVFEPDPDDTHVLACALTGSADYLVTGDAALLRLGSYGPTKIVSPREFLELLKSD